MYTLEMAYAHMRSLQELADRSRDHQLATSHRADKARTARGNKKKR
ncbi:hypothetical protein [Streptomyces sp. A5-4]